MTSEWVDEMEKKKKKRKREMKEKSETWRKKCRQAPSNTSVLATRKTSESHFLV